MAFNTVSQTDMRDRRRAGKAGMLATVSGKRNLINTFSNAFPQLRESKTLTVDSFAVGDYVYTIEGKTNTYASEAGDIDEAGVAAKIRDQINNDFQLRRIVNASILPSAPTEIVIAGNLPGIPFSANTADAKLTFADVNAAAEAEGIPFGRGLVHNGPSVVNPYPNKLVKLPELSDFNGGVQVFTPIVLNNENYIMTLNSDVGATPFATFLSSGAATAQEIVESMKAALDALAIPNLVVTEDDATLTIQLPVGYAQTNFGVSQWTATPMDLRSTPEKKFAGLSVFTQDEALHTLYNDERFGGMYAPNSQLMGLIDGDMYVDNTEVPVQGEPVYMECSGTIDERGRLYKTSSATRVMVPQLTWVQDEGDGTAQLTLAR